MLLIIFENIAKLTLIESNNWSWNEIVNYVIRYCKPTSNWSCKEDATHIYYVVSSLAKIIVIGLGKVATHVAKRREFTCEDGSHWSLTGSK